MPLNPRLRRGILDGLKASFYLMLGAWMVTCSACTRKIVTTVQLGAPETVSFDIPTLVHFDDIQQNFRLETVLCLFGVQKDHALLVTRYRAAFMSKRTESTAHYQNCTDTDFVGLLHNHPNGYCGFSPPDDRSFHAAKYPLDVLTCRDTIVFRIRGGDTRKLGIR